MLKDNYLRKFVKKKVELKLKVFHLKTRYSQKISK